MSILVPYEITDFWWDDVDDQLDRTDVTTSGTTVRPRLTDIQPSGRERYTKDEPVKKVSPRLHLDLTDAPKNFATATRNAVERASTRDTPPVTKKQIQKMIRTYHHFDRPKAGGKRL